MCDENGLVSGRAAFVSIRPVQFYHARDERAVGERRLLLAILEDAIRCFQTNLFARERRGRALFRDSEQWITSKDATHYFSFENICELLGIDAQSVRRSLHRWREEQLRRARVGRPAASTV